MSEVLLRECSCEQRLRVELLSKLDGGRDEVDGGDVEERLWLFGFCVFCLGRVLGWIFCSFIVDSTW